MSDPITIDDLFGFNLMHEVTDILKWNRVGCGSGTIMEDDKMKFKSMALELF